MKKLLVAACILVSSLTAFANNIEDDAIVAKFKVTTNKTNKLAHLTFIPTTSEKVTVKILNKQGNVIFREQILNKEGFSRPYNLSKLNGAEFSIIVTEGNTSYTEKISIGTEEIPTVSNYLIAKAKRIEDNKVELKVLQNAASPVFINVKNQFGHIIYEATVTDMVSFIQKFNLVKFAGTVTFEVTAGNESKSIVL